MQVVDENGNSMSDQSSKRVLAGILAIILGPLGIHKFILGYTQEGIITLIITFVLGVITCGIAAWAIGIITLVEGIIYLTKSDEDFVQIYQVNKKGWF
jgi:TM2 domain-containing membrane protein YozV